ncbi:MAG TPA: FliH/SctL family protein [Paludibaculum sp.]|jgi:flagellar assembly protein FliH
MASKIFNASMTPELTLHQWRPLGSNSELVDRALSQDAPVAPVEAPEEGFQLRLQQQCDLAFRQGEAAGRKSVQVEMDETSKALGRAIEAAASYKSRLRQEAEREVVNLALAVARRILRRQIQVDEEAILGLVKAAFENANLREVTQVRVHPQFAGVVGSHLLAIGAPVSIQLTGDASLELGGVLLETARGCLDASADTQLDEIGRGFADAVSVARRCP